MRRVMVSLVLLSVVVFGFVDANQRSPVYADDGVSIESETFYGPEIFARGRGAPVTETRTVSLDGYAAPFSLHIQNGDDLGRNRASSASISLDGRVVVSPSAFSPRVGGTSVEFHPDGSSVEIGVQISGGSGSEVTIWLEGRPVELAQFLTVWDDNSGAPIQVLHTAILDEEAGLDVNNDGEVDLLGTITIMPDTMLQVQVSRAPGVTGPLPVSVEAILPVPSGTSFNQQHVAFGYDNRGRNAPGTFEATLEVVGKQLRLEFTQDGGPGGSGIVAVVFDGNPIARHDATALQADYELVPESATVDVVFNSVVITHETSSSGAPANIKVQDHDQGLSLALGIVNIPTSLSFVFDPEASRFSYAASNPVSLLSVSASSSEAFFTKGRELRAEFHGVPTSFEVDLFQPDSLLEVQANAKFEQARLALASAAPALPDRSLPGDPLVDDRMSFHDSGESFALALRLTAFGVASINLQPFTVTLEHDQTASRVLHIDAMFGDDTDQVVIDARIDKPGTMTHITTDLHPGEPLRFVFDNSHNTHRFELDAIGIEGNASVQVAMDNVSRRMAVCLDDGPACQRPNPHSVQRYTSTATTTTSLDFDDFGTHGSETGPAFRTTMNASISRGGDGPPILLTNVRFRNVGIDIQDAINPHSSNCGTIPRLSMFVDSRGHPFVISSFQYPGMVNELRLGTDTNPARATSRIARLNGWSTGFFGCLGGVNTSTAGGLSSGGQQVLTLQTSVGSVNVFKFLTFQLLPLSGGTVTNPQPW